MVAVAITAILQVMRKRLKAQKILPKNPGIQKTLMTAAVVMAMAMMIQHVGVR